VSTQRTFAPKIVANSKVNKYPQISREKKLELIRKIIAIFLLDFDDTLAKAELLAFFACCTLINEVLCFFRITPLYTPETLLAEFRGRSAQDMVLELGKRHGFILVWRNGVDVTAEILLRFAKLSYKEMLAELGKEYVFTIKPVTLADGRVMNLKELVAEEMRRVIEIFSDKLEPTDGVAAVLEYLAPMFSLNICSSSAWERLMASLDGTKLRHIFEPVAEHVYSGTSHLVIPGLGRGKPFGDIWRWALRLLGFRPHQVVTVEDSKSGVDSCNNVAKEDEKHEAIAVILGYVGIHPEEKQEEEAEGLIEHGAEGILFNWDIDELINVVFEVLVNKGMIVLDA